MDKESGGCGKDGFGPSFLIIEPQNLNRLFFFFFAYIEDFISQSSLQEGMVI